MHIRVESMVIGHLDEDRFGLLATSIEFLFLLWLNPFKLGVMGKHPEHTIRV